MGLDLQLDANKEAQLQLLPQERVLNVKPSWAQTSNETRVDLLSISLEQLRLKAIDLADKAQKQAGNYHEYSTCCSARVLLCCCIAHAI